MSLSVALLSRVDPGQLQGARKLTQSSSNGSGSGSRKTSRSLPPPPSPVRSGKGSAVSTDDSPRGMTTSMSRNVKGQVTFETLKSPHKPLLSSSLASTAHLTESMMRVDRSGTQMSFSNDSTRYMDHTQSRRAACGGERSVRAQLSSAGNTLRHSAEGGGARGTSSLQVKTMYGSSAAWLMDFR